MNFDHAPQSSQKPEYSPEKLAEYLRDTDGVLEVSLRVLTRGMQVEMNEVYKPWPKKEVQKSLSSILAMFEVKIKYYEGAGEFDKAKEAGEKLERLKKLFSEIDKSEEVPPGFIQKVKQAVEAEMTP